MKSVAAACIALGLVTGMHPANVNAQARGESVLSLQERMNADSELADTTKRSDLEAWIPRLIGRWRFETRADGITRVDCTSIGSGPGVLCLSRVVKPNPATDPPEAPDFTLYGVDPDLPGVRNLRVSGLSIADHDEAGRLKGNTVTFQSPCPLPVHTPAPSRYAEPPPIPVRCEHQIRIFAPPDSNIVLFTRRTDMTFIIKGKIVTAPPRYEDHTWQRLADDDVSEPVLQLETKELESLEQYGKAEIPELVGHIADQAGKLAPAQRAALESQLAAYETSTSQRIIVATVGKLNGLPIERFSRQAAATWQLGNEARSDYILVVVAPNDGAARIEPGTAMRACVPDAAAQQILDETMIPDFRTQRFADGIQKGVASIMNACRELQAEAAEQ